VGRKALWGRHFRRKAAKAVEGGPFFPYRDIAWRLYVAQFRGASCTAFVQLQPEDAALRADARFSAYLIWRPLALLLSGLP
jgi:hypothetical protein